MAQNITLLGASYSNVPSVILPKTGGGTASFTDVSDTTAVASDVASGKYFYTSSGVRTQGTASGGGGNSRVLTGTFKGTSTGALDVNVPYTGNGYPIALTIYPEEGAYNRDGSFFSLIQRYAVNYYTAVKCNMTLAPNYDGTPYNDYGAYIFRYKNSASASNGYSSGGGNETSGYYSQSNVGNTAATLLRIRSKTKFSVYVASSSYCFAVGYTYRYVIEYSS